MATKRKAGAKPSPKRKGRVKRAAKPKARAKPSPKRKGGAKGVAKGKAESKPVAKPKTKKPTARERGKNPRGWPNWKGRPRWAWAFLNALATAPNVTQAAAAACITRQKVYERRKKDAVFARCWIQALDESIEALEAEAHRRAFEGVKEPVYYQGKRVDSVTKYSDILVMFLLKAHRPERYRERHDTKQPAGEPGLPEVHINVDLGILMAVRMQQLSAGAPAPGLRPLGGGPIQGDVER